MIVNLLLIALIKTIISDEYNNQQSIVTSQTTDPSIRGDRYYPKFEDYQILNNINNGYESEFESDPFEDVFDYNTDNITPEEEVVAPYNTAKYFEAQANTQVSNPAYPFVQNQIPNSSINNNVQIDNPTNVNSNLYRGYYTPSNINNNIAVDSPSEPTNNKFNQNYSFNPESKGNTVTDSPISPVNKNFNNKPYTESYINPTNQNDKFSKTYFNNKENKFENKGSGNISPEKHYNSDFKVDSPSKPDYKSQPHNEHATGFSKQYENKYNKQTDSIMNNYNKGYLNIKQNHDITFDTPKVETQGKGEINNITNKPISTGVTDAPSASIENIKYDAPTDFNHEFNDYKEIDKPGSSFMSHGSQAFTDKRPVFESQPTAIQIPENNIEYPEFSNNEYVNNDPEITFPQDTEEVIDVKPKLTKLQADSKLLNILNNASKETTDSPVANNQIDRAMDTMNKASKKYINPKDINKGFGENIDSPSKPVVQSSIQSYNKQYNLSPSKPIEKADNDIKDNFGKGSFKIIDSPSKVKDSGFKDEINDSYTNNYFDHDRKESEGSAGYSPISSNIPTVTDSAATDAKMNFNKPYVNSIQEGKGEVSDNKAKEQAVDHPNPITDPKGEYRHNYPIKQIDDKFAKTYASDNTKQDSKVLSKTDSATKPNSDTNWDEKPFLGKHEGNNNIPGFDKFDSNNHNSGLGQSFDDKRQTDSSSNNKEGKENDMMAKFYKKY